MIKNMGKAAFNQNFIIIACHYIHSTTGKIVTGIKRHTTRKGLLILAFGIPLLFISCGGGHKAPVESPTQGNIRIIADESFQPLIDTEVYTFTQLYLNAKIKPLYKPEYDVINDFMHDSVKVIVTSKKLTDDQIQYLQGYAGNCKDNHFCL